VFLASTIQSNVAKARAAATGSNILTADFQRIDDIVGNGHTVFVAADSTVVGCGGHAADFYLAGRYLQPSAETAEFVISQFRNDGPTLLTPHNARVFLYRRASILDLKPDGQGAPARPATAAPH
jgi:hypothetical protein